MGEVAEEGRPRPFYQRFDVEVASNEAKRRFQNRVSSRVFDRVYYALSERDRGSRKGGTAIRTLREVASALGERYEPTKRYEYYIGGDFRRCLQASEALYRALENISLPLQSEVSATVAEIINESETDLGIRWEPPIFVRTGAPLLNERLVNEPLRWLSEPQYGSVRRPFSKGLSHYLEA